MKNVTLMSVKTVSSDVILVVHQKEIDYMIYLRWKYHFLVYISFQSFSVNILPA